MLVGLECIISLMSSIKPEAILWLIYADITIFSCKYLIELS